MRKFSPVEIKEFGEFIRSPFFNKNEKVIKLYNYLKKNYNKADNRKLEKKYIHKKLFGNDKYNDGFMRTIIFNLTKLAEQYLIYLNNNRNNISANLSLLEELNSRQLYKHFIKTSNETEKMLGKTDMKESIYYFQKYRLESAMFFYMTLNRHHAKDEKFFNFDRIKDEFKFLTMYYMIHALGNYRFLIYENEYVHRIKIDLEFSDQIIDFLEKNESIYNDIPLIKLHLNEILLIKNKNNDSYVKLKDMLIKSKNELSHNNRFSLHSILQEYCRIKHLEGKEEFLRERFDLFKIALGQGLYAIEGDTYIDDKFFEIILSTAISLNEFEWANKFINTYKNLLAPKNADTVIKIVRARLSSAIGEYDKSLEHLNQIGIIRDIQYKCVVKIMMLVAYYELKHFEQVQYSLDAFRHFINNNRLSFMAIDIQRYDNFRKFLYRLVKIKLDGKVDEVSGFIDSVNKTQHVYNKKWLTKKAVDLRRS